MAVTTISLATIGSAGNFTVSSGTFVDAVLNSDTAYVSSGATSTQFYGTIPDVNPDTPVNSLKVRIRARLAVAGSRSLGAGVTAGTLSYHPTVYTVTSTDWAEYEFEWTTNPITGLPWTPADIDGITRIYVRCTLVSGTTDLQVDRVQVDVDHGGASGQIYNRSITENISVTDTVTKVLGSDQRTITENIQVTDQILVSFTQGTPEADVVVSRNWISVGSAGAWLPSAGTILDAVANVGGEYAIAGLTSSNMYGSINNPTVLDPVQWVRVVMVARLVEPGARNLNAGLVVGTASPILHANNRIVNSTAWSEFSWVFSVNPFTLQPWTANDILNITRIHARASAVDGTTDMHVDYVRVDVGYNVAPTGAINYERTLTESIRVTDMDLPYSIIIDDETPSPAVNYERVITENIQITDSVQFIIPGEVELGAFRFRGRTIKAIYLGRYLIWSRQQ